MASANSPVDFPIPSGLQGFWQWDKVHCPRSQTALTQDLFNSAITAGFSSAMEELACPVGVQQININTYAYLALLPFKLVDETIEQRVARYKENLAGILPNLGEL